MISRKKLKDFCQADTGRKQHERSFESWFKLARKARWQNFQEARCTFGQIDVATGSGGRTATIFDVGGNKYRIVAHVDYTRQTIKIEAIMSHKEYDKGLWRKLF